MPTPWVRVSIAVFIVGTICAGSSFACSCGAGPPTSNCSDLKPIGPSFIGTVIFIENPPDERTGADEAGLSRYRFRVDENISGFEEKEVDVYSGRGQADCSYHFGLGKSYFVSPYTTPESVLTHPAEVPTEKLMAGICTQTRPLESAAALLQELRARKKGGATVLGVLRTEPGPDDYNHRIPDATLELRAENTTLSTQTDIGGVYRFDGVPVGRYQFVVRLPAEWQVAGNKAPVLPSIAIADKPCYAKDIYTRSTAQTEGP
jgi:hypothetical protein